jgi:2-dehydro-3-deoxyphosphogluconate aldolase/(4S)-4-hydroxy-2-oxoglutarate aldolase
MHQQLLQTKVLPIATVTSVQEAIHVCEALCAADLPLVEITFRNSAAELALRAAVQKFPQMAIGAGTILNVAELQRAHLAGAQFAASTGTNPRVVDAATKRELPMIPGVASPSDIERALDLGCRLVKFFPSEALGGPALLKAVLAPYLHTGLKVIATGGITARNLRDYLALEGVVAVGGSWLVAPRYLRQGDWLSVTEVAREACYLAHKT